MITLYSWATLEYFVLVFASANLNSLPIQIDVDQSSALQSSLRRAKDRMIALTSKRGEVVTMGPLTVFYEADEEFGFSGGMGDGGELS